LSNLVAQIDPVHAFSESLKSSIEHFIQLTALKRAASVIGMFFIVSLLLLSNRSYAQQKIGRQYLAEEFRILRTTLQELHPDLYRYTGQAEFNAKADSILNSLESDLDPIEFYLRISPMVTQIRNGHTAIRPPQRVCDSMTVFPLRVISFEGKVYVYKDLSGNHGKLIGSEIKTINDVPVNEVVDKAIKHVSVDGFNDNARFKAVVEDDLALYYSLLYGQSSQFEIEFANESWQKSLKQKLQGITYHEFLSKYDLGDEFPWSLHKIDSSDAALLTIRSFNTFAYEGDKKIYFHKIIADFFAAIKAWGVNKLVLDIRFNGGGELKNSILLYSFLVKTSVQFTKQIEMASIVPPFYVQFTNYRQALKYDPIHADQATKKSDRTFYISDHFSQKYVEPKKERFNGKLILLINGNTASAAGALASCIRNDKRGLIVGEENRDNYTGFSAGVPIILTLPYSGVVVTIPIRKFTYAVTEDTGRGVIPDYTVPSTAEDFFKQKNVAVDFALELFKT
jgi:hypothetical protein